VTAIISARGLVKSFGDHRGVDGLDFEVNAGEVFGYLGPNGSGKTTTIRLLLGLYHPSAGSARVFGRDPCLDGPDTLGRIGYLPGEFALHPRMTGRQYVDLVARARGMESRATCDELVERFDVTLDRPAHTLSKGNRQKIGLVLAFMHRPELLILDEPTSGLDPLMQREFQRLVRETVDEGRTVFLSSHELDEVQRVVDRLAILREGQIVVTDTVGGLRQAVARTLELRFSTPVDATVFAAIEGVDVLETDGDRITLSLRGPLAPVLAAAATLDAVDIVARPADLDELFLTYYRGRADDASLGR
jgi:beta-exotoxin I transport system ATP-binding protein